MSAKRTIRPLLLLIVINCAVSSVARADDHSIVAAATANAVDALREDVALSRIDARLTVADFLKKTGGNRQLLSVLQRAEEVGGPRFSADGQACEIQVEISGDRVARELVSIAAANPKQSPVPADVLSRELSEWRSRMFSGTGSSVSGASVKFVRPAAVAPEDAWSGVSDAARQQAVDAARDNAVHHALDAIEPIQFTAGQTVGSLLANKSISDPVVAWLSSRPVRQVQFTPQREVELTLWAPPDELCGQLFLAVQQAKQPMPDSTDQKKLRQQMEALPGEVVGRAAVHTEAASQAVVAVVLPAYPPAWTDEQIVGEGVAEARTSKLKTARAAQAAAMDALRKEVNALRLSETLTVGEAAERSPAIDRAIERCVHASQPFKVEYRADGSVLVRSVLNSRELWLAMSGQE